MFLPPALVTIALGTLAALAGCTQACTLRGCQDQFSATVARSDGSMPSGTHRIDLTADGRSLSCSFTFPLPALPTGATVEPTCSGGLQVTVGQATICTSTVSNGSATLRCDPIPGHFVEQITVPGAPTQIRAQQSVDGTSILDESLTPTYQSSQPNGPDCEPTCQQATATWTLS